MIREARAVVLLLLGNAMLRLALGGGYVDYVKPAMRIPLIVAGAALALLGAGRLLELVLGHAHGHGHDHGPRVAWLLVLPVFAILLIAPPPLGAYAAGRESGAVARPASTEYAPLPAGRRPACGCRTTRCGPSGIRGARLPTARSRSPAS